MSIFWRDDFERHGDAELDATAYPPLTGGDFSGNAPIIYNESVCRWESSLGNAGFKYGFDMPTPDWVLECTLNIASKTHLGAIYLLGRLQSSGTQRHYAVVIGTTSDASNTYILDDTVDAPLVEAGQVYIFEFDGTDATIKAQAAYAFDLATDYRIRMELGGDRISLSIDGTVVLLASDTTWRLGGWGFGRWGIGARMIGAGSGSGLFDIDDLTIYVASHFVEAQAAYDELRGLIKFTLPGLGGVFSADLATYHVATGEWTLDDRRVTCLGEYLDHTGRRVILEADLDGYVHEVDGSESLDGTTALDAEWESNWLELAPGEQPVTVEAVLVRLAQAVDLGVEVTVTVADDPSDPRTYSKTVLRSGYKAWEPAVINRSARFVKFGARHAGLTGDLRLRRLGLDILK